MEECVVLFVGKGMCMYVRLTVAAESICLLFKNANPRFAQHRLFAMSMTLPMARAMSRARRGEREHQVSVWVLDLDALRRLTQLHQQSSFARVDVALADHVRHGQGDPRAPSPGRDGGRRPGLTMPPVCLRRGVRPACRRASPYRRRRRTGMAMSSQETPVQHLHMLVQRH
jgi:hypothetical protein